MEEKIKMSRLVSCILNLPVLHCPHYSLRTNDLHLEIIVISVSLTLGLLPLELCWSSTT